MYAQSMGVSPDRTPRGVTWSSASDETFGVKRSLERFQHGHLAVRTVLIALYALHDYLTPAQDGMFHGHNQLTVYDGTAGAVVNVPAGPTASRMDRT